MKQQWQLAVSNKNHRDQFQCATHLTNGLSGKLACISALFQHDGWKAGQCLSDRSDCARIVMCMCTMVGAPVRSLMRPQSSMTNRHGFSIFTWAKLRVPPPPPPPPLSWSIPLWCQECSRGGTRVITVFRGKPAQTKSNTNQQPLSGR